MHSSYRTGTTIGIKVRVKVGIAGTVPVSGVFVQPSTSITRVRVPVLVPVQLSK
jgi:hypothetical protein